MKNDCVFCAIAAGEIPSFKVYEDDLVLAYLDINPFSKGHTLVIPKIHTTGLLDTPDETLAAVISRVRKVAAHLKAVLPCDGFNILQNNGAPDVRFVWTTLELLKRNPQLAAWLKQRATLAGLYLVTPRGISGAPQDRANAALYQVRGVPPPPEPKPAPLVPDFGILTLGLVSLTATLAALTCLFKRS